jgi:hypothetical protein
VVRVLAIVLTMLLILLVSAGVVIYVAYPHRGEELPVVPQLGDAMRKGVDALPTLDETAHDEVGHDHAGRREVKHSA